MPMTPWLHARSRAALGLLRKAGCAGAALMLALTLGAAPASASGTVAKAAKAAASKPSKAAGAAPASARGARTAHGAVPARRRELRKPPGPIEVHLPSPPAASVAPLQPPTVHRGCWGDAAGPQAGPPLAQLTDWLAGPAGAGANCRRYAAVSLPGSPDGPATLAVLAGDGTRALVVSRREALAEPSTQWLDLEPDAEGMHELWLPSGLGAGALAGVPAGLQNELGLLARMMKKQSGAPEAALLRVWLQGAGEEATLQAVELVDLRSGQAYETAVRVDRPEGRSAYISSLGIEYERMLWQSPVDHLRVSRGIGASSMLVRKRSVVKTQARGHARARSRIVVQAFRYKTQHIGIDFAAPTGTPVVAVADGEVEFAGWRGGYGKLILLRHGEELTTYYGHLSAFAPDLQPGQHVRRGQAIGLVGSTGFSTGPHLHFEIRKGERYIDPTRADLRLPVWTLQADEHLTLVSRLLQLELTRTRALPVPAQPDS